jgi:Uroporphyrinogen decarboxylase (URO-D)
MTPKERMLRAGRGEWADRLPWAPRIDLWYNANSYRATLPPKYRPGVTLDEIADDIGGAYHKVVGDYLHARTPEDHLDRAIGVQHRWGLPYRRELVGVDREVKREGDTTEVIYHTPLGSVSCKTKYTDEMRRAGISIAWKAERVIKRPEDYKILGYIFKNIKIHPDYENYLDFKNRVGEKGMAVACANDSAGPMHHIMRNFLGETEFYFEMYDHSGEMKQLCEDMDPFFDQIIRAAADAPAEVVLFGSNYDEMITYPPFFKRYIMPYLQKMADRLHSQKKLLLCHCDGENQGLLDLLAHCGMDIAEAICPRPMTKVTISDVRRAFQGKVTIFGGVSSVALLENSMSDEEFERFMKDLFKQIAPGDRFILGVSDTTPPDAKFERLLRITEMVNDWGALPMKVD